LVVEEADLKTQALRGRPLKSAAPVGEVQYLALLGQMVQQVLQGKEVPVAMDIHLVVFTVEVEVVEQVP
jgi:hypothetical protein